MYIAYVDESGNVGPHGTRTYTLACVLVPADQWPAGPERTIRTVQVTYSPDEWALLQGRFPMSEEDWDSMIAVLEAMKRGLVTRRAPSMSSRALPGLA